MASSNRRSGNGASRLVSEGPLRPGGPFLGSSSGSAQVDRLAPPCLGIGDSRCLGSGPSLVGHFLSFHLGLSDDIVGARWLAADVRTLLGRLRGLMLSCLVQLGKDAAGAHGRGWCCQLPLECLPVQNWCWIKGLCGQAMGCINEYDAWATAR